MSTFVSRPVVLHSSEARSSAPRGNSTPCPLCADSDEGLIERIALGRQDAIEHFFDRHYSLVFRVALRIVRDEGEAQDIAQEVFFQFVRQLHLFDRAKGSPRTWIVAIAHHRSLDRRQYLSYRRFYHQVEIDSLPEAISAALNRPYEAPRLMAHSGLDLAFGALSLAQQETIRLHCFEGLPFREIAGLRGESLANTRHHYYRAIEKIREFLCDEAKSSARSRRNRPAVQEGL